MNLHLAAISADVTPGRHAVLLLDQAGWHLSHKLVVPPNITIVPLPPKCPELNPQENVWQYLRDNWLSNRVFDNHNALLDHCCDAWNNHRQRVVARIDLHFLGVTHLALCHCLVAPLSSRSPGPPASPIGTLRTDR
jgi:transposase